MNQHEQDGLRNDNEDEELDADDWESDDEDDEGDEDESLLVELLEDFLGFIEIGEDLDATQEDVLRFAAIATHIHLYRVMTDAEQRKEDPRRAALEWVQHYSQYFAELLTSNDLLKAAGELIGQPQLSLKFDRKFRRTLQR
jgi:hypothetical protein